MEDINVKSVRYPKSTDEKLEKIVETGETEKIGGYTDGELFLWYKKRSDRFQ